jgi:hypothetical protein
MVRPDSPAAFRIVFSHHEVLAILGVPLSAKPRRPVKKAEPKDDGK